MKSWCIFGVCQCIFCNTIYIYITGWYFIDVFSYLQPFWEGHKSQVREAF